MLMTIARRGVRCLGGRRRRHAAAGRRRSGGSQDDEAPSGASEVARAVPPRPLAVGRR
jgi:hypothetical protein